jgi:predicted metal-binding membrane protein
MWIAVPVFLLAWQVMLAAMMLPSSLPLVRLFAKASRGNRGRAPRWRDSSAATRSCGPGSGALAFLFDVGVHATVDASPWLQDHSWILAAGVLAVAGASSSRRSSTRASTSAGIRLSSCSVSTGAEQEAGCGSA